MNDLPKVLVIASTPFSKTKNNGKTLSSFFETYDRTLIAQFSYSGGDFNSDICDNYYFFTKEDVLRGNKGAAYKSAGILMKENIMESGKKKSFIKRFFHVFSQARNPIALWIKDRIWKKADYSKALDWIDQFDPDAVFFQGFSMAYGYDFALSVCKRNNIPLILELTDDYTYRLYPLSIIEKINHKRYMNVFTEAITLASKTIVISDLMKEEYESRFGGDMDVMMNAVNTKNFNYDCERTPNDYVYAGNLLLNRWKVLRIWIYNPSVKKIAERLNREITVEDYERNATEFIKKCASESNGTRIKKYITDAVTYCRNENV